MTTQPLAQLTTLRVGGAPDGLVVASTTDQLVAAVRLAAELEQPLLVVGGGSNLLVADSGFAGTAVLVRNQGIDSNNRPDGSVVVTVEAGQVWDDFVAWAVEQGLSGVESLSGIPGLTGATPIQNVGAYGQEVSSIIDSVETIHRYTGDARVFTQDDLKFGYRSSIFKERKDVFVITRVYFVLQVSELSAPIGYAELAQALGVEIGERAPLAAVRAAVLALRAGKGMVLDDNDFDTWSAGSFFTNPVLDEAAATRLPDGAPRWPQPDGQVKTSAAWLIENAGFGKGFGTGSARLSTKHVLALTNADGHASAADIVELARTIRDGVQQKFDITLEPEPVLVGLEL
jgi:UDP-N-acetylmuramate dehydrogenase